MIILTMRPKISIEFLSGKSTYKKFSCAPKTGPDSFVFTYIFAGIRGQKPPTPPQTRFCAPTGNPGSASESLPCWEFNLRPPTRQVCMLTTKLSSEREGVKDFAQESIPNQFQVDVFQIDEIQCRGPRNKFHCPQTCG